MRTKLIVIVFGLLLACGAGCSVNRSTPGGDDRNDAAPVDDARLNKDTKPLARDTSSPTGTCPAGGRGYVIDRILVPTNSTESQKYALHFNGKMYNSLGGILALLAAQAPGINIQSGINETICQGGALHLLCLRSKGLVADPNATAQTWPASAGCCSTPPCFSVAQGRCGGTAPARCFSASSTLSPTKGQPARKTSGSINGGHLELGPGEGVIVLPLSGAGMPGTLAIINLKKATISGKLQGNRIIDGVLTGGIDRAVIQNQLVPILAATFNGVYTSSFTDQKTKDLLRTLFDMNKDGKITAQEVLNNGLIKTFLDGDVDLDGDNIKELSLGVGFTAVGVNIK